MVMKRKRKRVTYTKFIENQKEKKIKEWKKLLRVTNQKITKGMYKVRKRKKFKLSACLIVFCGNRYVGRRLGS
jgi:hypothetical protein